jgi:flagellar hook-associated protein 3 FlgL
MRIATSQLFDRPSSRMAALTEQADRIQAQIATGKRVVAASDDAGAWLRLEGLRRDDAGGKADAANVKLAQGLVAQTDTALESVDTQLQRVQEIAVATSNGTLSAANRAAYGTELSGIVDELLALANSGDVRGQPIFGGADGGAAFVRGSDGTISYAGQGEPAGIPVGGSSVATGITGDRAFGDMFATLAALSAALADGETPPAGIGDGIQAAVDQVSAARASVGARAIRLDLEATRLDGAAIDREDARNDIEATDISAAITELQKTLTILQATQASFTKLSSLSLFDYLR